jgi:hypothetical protein
MVEWSRRRRGMYDITKTRMLLTTAVFAAVAALSASGANARIPADSSSASAVQESLRTGHYAALPPSWRGKGGKGEETGGATNTLQQTGVARSGSRYTFPECSLGPCHFDELLPARLGLATRAASAPTSKFPAGYRGLP